MAEKSAVCSPYSVDVEDLCTRRFNSLLNWKAVSGPGVYLYNVWSSSLYAF